MPLLVAAPDKFRGTATAAAVAASAADGARAAGWRAVEVPLADGGEGTLEAVARSTGSELVRTSVSGPLGGSVDATWLVLRDTRRVRLPPPLVPGDDPTAVVEAASAAGRALVRGPSGEDPVRASTAGVGELLLAARDAGARQVVVAVGGTATTDGGEGALGALAAGGGLGGTRLVVACDVATSFTEAARLFGPQKGATGAQVARLTARLGALARRYLDERGVDVEDLPGSGAGGGLAGGLASAGGALVPGFDLVAGLVDLDGALGGADLVMTGEGRLDATSFEGKVVGGVLGALGGAPAVLCVTGDAAAGVEAAWAGRPGPVELVRLVHDFGERRARGETTALVADVVVARLRAWPGSADGAG